MYSQEDKLEASSTPQVSMEIKLRDSICRNKSPIMVDLMFKNISAKPKKMCIYKFYDSLLRLEIKNSKGQKIEFAPKVITAGSISSKDWVEIQPDRVHKQTFSLNKMVIDATGSRIKPDNYNIKATYEGCSKFDSTLPVEKMESNVLFLMITE